MATELSKLMVVIGADVRDFQSKMEGMKASMKKIGMAMTGAGTVIVGSMVGVTFQWAKAGDEVQKLSEKTGFSTESLSELRHAAELSGTSLQGLESGIKVMQRSLYDASQGLSTATDALDSLGLSYEELASLSPEEQFKAITNALADVEDESLKSALAQKVFGRAGTDLLPMLAQGSQGLADMRQGRCCHSGLSSG